MDRDRNFFSSSQLGHTYYSRALRNQPRVLDLGANHGRFAAEMYDLFGADVRMVEANPLLHAELSNQGRFPVYHYAVTDKDGSIRFNIAQNDAGSSILDLPAASEYNCVLRETVTVPTSTVASLLHEIGWDRVDLIKMDIEGAEVDVLNSLTPDLINRIGQITIEFHSHPTFHFNIARQVEDCLATMRKHGFLVIDFTYPARIDVLLINTKLIRLPLTERLWWNCMYNPPRVLDYFLRTFTPSTVRRMLGNWRRRVTHN